MLLQARQPKIPVNITIRYLLGRDRTSAARPEHIVPQDWPDGPATFPTLACRLPHRIDRVGPRIGLLLPPKLRRMLCVCVARCCVTAGIRLLGQASRIVTDRLHGHILALLLGKEHAILDNAMGKVLSYATCCSQGVAGVHILQTEDEITRTPTNWGDRPPDSVRVDAIWPRLDVEDRFHKKGKVIGDRKSHQFAA